MLILISNVILGIKTYGERLAYTWITIGKYLAKIYDTLGNDTGVLKIMNKVSTGQISTWLSTHLQILLRSCLKHQA